METALFRSIMVAMPDIDEFNAKKMDEFTALFERFFRWERERLLLSDPTDEEKRDHEEFVRFALRLVKLLRVIDQSDRLEMLQTRLADSWLIFHNPLSKEQAEKILADVFPG